MVLEFERADRMGYALDRIRLAVRKIIGRVDAPFRTGARMLGMQDAVQHGVAQIDVAGSHIDLGPQNARAVRKLAGAHAAEQVKVFIGAAIAIRAVAARLRQRAAHCPHLVGRCVVDIGVAGSDQMLGPVVELLEIVRRVIEVPAPIKAEPAHIAFDRIDIFLLLLGRVCIVETQMAASAEFLGDTEIEADRFGVPDMKITVGLGREAGHDLLAAAGLQIGRNDVADEIAPALYCGRLDRAHDYPAPLLRRCYVADRTPRAKPLPDRAPVSPTSACA